MTCGHLECALQKAALIEVIMWKKKKNYGICQLLSIKWMKIVEPNVFLSY